MIHLISVEGKSARKFHLPAECTSDFKSLIRTVVSGRTMIVSTKFRTDLFYHSEKGRNVPIVKLWALYAKANTAELSPDDFHTADGDEESLTEYFVSINGISKNWYQYKMYKKAFLRAYNRDPKNPIVGTVSQCDQYLLGRTRISRAPLTPHTMKIDPRVIRDAFPLAMKVINNDSHEN